MCAVKRKSPCQARQRVFVFCVEQAKLEKNWVVIRAERVVLQALPLLNTVSQGRACKSEVNVTRFCGRRHVESWGAVVETRHTGCVERVHNFNTSGCDFRGSPFWMVSIEVATYK